MILSKKTMYSTETKNIALEISSSPRLNIYLQTKINHEKINKIINCTTFLNENAKIKERIFCVINDINTKITCKQCTTYIKFNTYKNNYAQLCNACSHNSVAQKKARKTNLERYGVDSFSKTKKFKDKTRKTNLERYGVDSFSKTKKFKDKVKQTSIERYGVDNVFKSKDIKDKVKQTNIERYGVDNYSKTKECQDKIKQTNIERYGINHYSKNKECQDKIKQTSIERYGVDSYSKTKECQDKIKQTNIERYGVECENQKHMLSIMSFLNDKKWMYNEHITKQKSLTQIAYDLKIAPSTAVTYLKKHNIKAHYYSYSFAEKEINEFIKGIESNILTNTKTIIPPKEIDIYLPNKKIAIEYNGLYWHSELFKEKSYHIDKTLLCHEQDIQLIHIFEHEWTFKTNIVKSRLKSMLGKNTKIFARKCNIKEISYKESKLFLNRTHLQGNSVSKIRIGLFYNDNLVLVMTFGTPRFKSDYEYELLRFSSELNTNVIGGASKLFIYFLKKYMPTSIISYCDLQYGTGTIYEKLNFKKIRTSPPNFIYVKNSIIKSRYQAQKHKQHMFLDDFNPLLSAHKNMLNNNWLRVYDCGNSVWEWHQPQVNSAPIPHSSTLLTT